MSEPSIGIDLGTTNSAVATLIRGKPRVIERRDGGGRLLPSMVGFAPSGDRLVGDPARVLAETYPETVAWAVKRFMGQRWTPELAATARGILPYALVAGPNEDVRVKLGGRVLPVVQVAAMLLSELRLDAETWFNREVRRAVITVPANFNDAQRQATKEAASIAGLEVLRLVNEPTAAALAYGLDSSFQGRALVFDLGGGTFDISVLEVRNGVFEVIATGGDPFLGGEDFDQAIVRWLLAQLDEPLRERVQRDKLSMQRLKVVAENAKRAVSAKDEAQISVELSPHDEPFLLETLLTREFFEMIVQGPAQRCLEIVDRTLAEAGLDPRGMSAVLLVGGMTRVPLVRRMVTDHFGRSPVEGLDPDEVVALGAAVHADDLSTRASSSTLLMDVVSSTLSLGLAGGVCKPLIPKNRALPCTAREVVHPGRDGQTIVRLPVLQGEGRRVEENFLLGELTLEGLRAAPRGDVALEVLFEMGSDGVLSVQAMDLATGRSESARILARTDLNAGERDRMANDEARHHQNIAQKIESQALARDRAQRQSLTDAIERIRKLHRVLAKAAEESGNDEARAVVEAVESQLAHALEVEKTGGIDQLERTAAELNELYARMTAAAA